MAHPLTPGAGQPAPPGKMLRTLRLDPSDTLIFPAAAEPGEWAVPGGFQFWDDAPDGLSGKRQQAFRGGFLGLGSFGWSTLVEVAEIGPEARAAALEALALHIQARHGAPDLDAARAAAAEEIAFAESLCDQPPGTVFALHRSHDATGEVREAFRTLHRRETPHHDFGALPVFAIAEVEEDPPADAPDLTALLTASSLKDGP
ncbi:DUF6505 family protein [Sediminicoccus sp. KRV36]|uniref:DUF6505 family protein n=1 Tax=Sediminicoccus sp. KRV36 TaxID=3133721 RepID=UPI00200FC73B|nr:DUF6505 family protein [Sediminicoccus rosea]UPY37819.1 DUF6505 family protein [Sediminicoccus rosea]